MPYNTKRLLSDRVDLTSRLHETPYSLLIYLQRALCHETLDYPDLAAADAYKALMLYDELEGGEFEEEVRSTLSVQILDVMWSEMLPRMELTAPQDSGDLEQFLSHCIPHLYLVLVRNLISCGDEEAALRFMRQARTAFPENGALKTLLDRLSGKTLVESDDYADDFSAISEIARLTSSSACVRREVYPWNKYEPDRFSDESLGLLNDEMQRYAPKCAVIATQLPVLSRGEPLALKKEEPGSSPKQSRQLGIFARETIAPGEVILLEPSVLTASSRQLDLVCDACSATLPELSAGVNISCPSCSDIYFCSEICRKRAQELYHPAVCGIDGYDIVAKDPSLKNATDSLYVLLAARAFAMAETQDLHPLDLAHTKYLWGEFECAGRGSDIRTLPFRFETNIAQPLQILMNMGLDIFLPRSLERYDVWVINTLLAKFRGVASARFNQRTLRPDVAAVHPLWCLANHSCAPNIRWEWGAEEGIFRGSETGAMGFAARQEKEIVQWGDETRTAGIAKGEELLNHYCDVGMDVRERREWAAGALGGQCTCERCTWEAEVR